MYTDALQCKRASVANGMVNPGVDVIPSSRFVFWFVFFQKLQSCSTIFALRLNIGSNSPRSVTFAEMHGKGSEVVQAARAN